MFVKKYSNGFTEPQWKTLFKFINETSSLRPETFLEGQSSDDAAVLHQQQGKLLCYVVLLFYMSKRSSINHELVIEYKSRMPPISHVVSRLTVQ